MSESDKTELIVAAESGNLVKLNEILANPPEDFDIEAYSDYDGQSMRALDYACQEGHLDIVKALMNNGADYNGYHDFPPIIFAVQNGTFEGPRETWSSHWDVIQFLILECNVDPSGDNHHPSAHTNVFETPMSLDLEAFFTAQIDIWNIMQASENPGAPVMIE